MFAIFVLPETKGRSLEELEQELSELRICSGTSRTSQAQHSFENDRENAAAQSQSHSCKGEGMAGIAAPSKIEWEQEFERTIGLHSTGGVGMQK
eukprot:COSAG02_NODE_24_length_52386_cov_726.042898_8_plen_94_part_00